MSRTDSGQSFSLLVVDDDDIIRESMISYLETYHESSYKLDIVVSTTAPDALQLLENRTFDLVISDINLPGGSGFDVLAFAKNKSPDTKVVLMTAYKVKDYIRTAKETGIFNIVAKTAPFNFEELSAVINNLLQPDTCFNLENYLEPGTMTQETHIMKSDDIMTVFNCLKQFFKDSPVRDVNNLATAIIEALTNAVYHAAKTRDGKLKYEKGQVIEQLDADEVVIVRYGKDSEKVGVSIIDQGGRISADDVLYWLDRNISGSGIMDTHGRGVYMIHTLVDRMIVNIAPLKRTEIIILDFFNPDYSSNKPLYINQL